MISRPTDTDTRRLPSSSQPLPTVSSKERVVHLPASLCWVVLPYVQRRVKRRLNSIQAG